MPSIAPTALLAEDEPLLAQALKAELARAWPELQVVAVVGDGTSAVEEALLHRPDVLFFDIRMPGQDGLAAAAELADRWPDDGSSLPQLVFVTAHDEYAARAFDAQALDYVLKPVKPQRLLRTVTRLQQALAAAEGMPSTPALASAPSSAPSPALASAPNPLEQTLAQWRQLLAAAGGALPLPGLPAPTGATPLRFITASDAGGNTVRLLPIDEVICFEAADKYVRVLTAAQEHLIRTPLKQLLPQLDPGVFWQVHRAVVVRASAIEQVQRDETGKLHLNLSGRPGERIVVSRLYAPLFKAM